MQNLLIFFGAYALGVYTAEQAREVAPFLDPKKKDDTPVSTNP